MFLMIELWKERHAFSHLSSEDRREKVEQIGLEPLEAKGVQLLGIARLGPEAGGILGGEWDYATAWSAPTKELVHEVVHREKGHPWLTEFFDRKVVVGDYVGRTLDDLLEAFAPAAPIRPGKPGLMTRMGDLEGRLSGMGERFERVEELLYRLVNTSEEKRSEPGPPQQGGGSRSRRRDSEEKWPSE